MFGAVLTLKFSMSAAKKYKLELQADTENNLNNRLKRNEINFFSPSTSTGLTSGGAAQRSALGQNMNSQSQLPFGNGSGGGGGGSSGDGDRRANFSMLDNSHLNEHRSSTTTSAYFNKMGVQNASKPGDVKKLVIKNFKGNYKLEVLVKNNIRQTI